MGLHANSLATLFSVAAVSLATGYYLGQVCPAVKSKRQQVQDTLINCKKQAEREEEAYKDSLADDDTGDDDESDEEEYEINSLSLNDIPGEVRMALVIRQDLGMQKGKVAAQCCHAALACYRLIASDPTRDSYNPEMTERWLRCGQAKITLKCPDKETMDELFAKAISLGVNSYVVHDAGRTQIAAGSATVLGLGPAPKAVMDQITGDLKLY
ncbi:LAFE_0B01838g1_1 [Lachancea fermentati]|uniref:peptidyl-tRNA hydrolase n=1 Tax=Lachancea fermentati TaxID=4955 RepID=A0A1G4M7D9_LACFM|nr:LAFE_0B01838g1_1 [Lachancea fermentati]